MKTNKNDETILAGYTRVTEFLTPYKDFDNVPPAILANACNRGDVTHEFCDLYALNMLIEKPSEQVKPYFESFKQWHDGFVLETIMTETRIHHPSLFIAGQFDWLGKLKGSDEIVLADWKTPKLHEISWRMQMAAYRFLLREIMGIHVDRRISVRLDDKGNFPTVCEYLDHDHDERLFLNQVEIYRCFYPRIKPV